MIKNRQGRLKALLRNVILNLESKSHGKIAFKPNGGNLSNPVYGSFEMKKFDETTTSGYINFQ